MTRCIIAVYSVLLCVAQLLSAQQPTAWAPTATKTAASVMTLTDQDNGKTIELKKGATLIMQLSSNASTGYRWSAPSSTSVLKLIKSDYKEQNQRTPIAGAPGVQTFEWQAAGPGTATLQLEYRRAWEKNVSPAKVFSITLRVR